MSAVLSLLATNALAAGALALLAWVAGRATKRPAVVHGLWLLALLKLVTPPVLPVPMLPEWRTLVPAPPAPVAVPMRAVASASLLGPPADVRSLRLPVAVGSAASVRPRPRPAVGIAAPATDPVPDPAPALPAIAAGMTLLALGSLFIAALTLSRFRRFRRLLETAETAPPSVAERARVIASHLGLRAAPPLLLVAATVPPMLWPSRRGPRLLLPRRLLPELTADERDALLAHELAHVRRRDHWVRFVEIAATALFWWYPVTWWARRALRRAEERCCDEWVLRVLPASAGAYASGLLKSLAFVSGESQPLPVGASGAVPVQDLEARLKEILMTRPLPRLAAPFRLGLAAAALAGLAVFPTPAQSDAKRSEPAAEQAAPAAEPLPSPALAPDALPPAPRRPVALPARAGAPADARPVVGPKGIVGPVGVVSADVTPAPAIAAGAVASGVRGGVAGGVVAGVPVGGVGDPDLVVVDERPEDPAIAAERAALDEQRRKLREQQIELEGKALDLEARAEQKRLADETARLRADGRTAEAERLEKQMRLDAKRIDLQRRHLDLELESARLEAEMEKAARSGADESQLEHGRQQLETKQLALATEMEKAQRELEAVEAEARVEELRRSTGDLERSLAEHLESLQSALPEAGAQRAELEREIARLRSALDLLATPATGVKTKRTTTQPPTPAPSNR